MIDVTSETFVFGCLRTSCLTPHGTTCDCAQKINAGVKGLRIGVISEAFAVCDKVVIDAFREAMSQLRELGAQVDEVRERVNGTTMILEVRVFFKKSLSAAYLDKLFIV